MGLGLFIAKTLLERSGARLHFENGAEPSAGEREPSAPMGAVVTVLWPRAGVSPEAGTAGAPLAPRAPLQA
jgi:two-component system sensor histidine kinase RegB